MASYDGLLTEEQRWPFHLAFPDDAFSKDAETVAAALRRSIAANSSDGEVLSSELINFLFLKPATSSLVQTPAGSGASENEVSVSKRRRCNIPPPRGKIAKRKPRASTTTFITADPADFRWMVQQVTGARFSSLDDTPPKSAALNLEPRMQLMNRLENGVGLPTLDTSPFLLNSSAGGAVESRRYAEPLCSFPTLESWNAT